MTERTYAGHFCEVARCHNLAIDQAGLGARQPCPRSLSQAVYRLAPGWCVKLLEPESVEAGKLPAERAILGIVEGRLPVPKLLGYGTTEAKPVRMYSIYQWVEGDLWKEVVHKLGREERLQLLRDAREYLGRLHSLPVADPAAAPEIPRGNYQRWRTRNLSILDHNLRFLVNVSELTRTQADRVLEIPYYECRSFVIRLIEWNLC